MAEATKESAQLAQDYTEMWNEREYSKIPDLVAESFVVHNAALPEGEARGHDGLEEWIRTVTSGFPDFHVDIRNLLANEEMVMVEVTYTMTHEGEFVGVEPTGREVELPGMAKLLTEGGRVTEHWDYVDRQDLFEQLGVTEGQRKDGETP